MTTPHDHQPNQAEAHEGPIKTPKQLILAVFFAFVVPIVVIVLLVKFVVTDQRNAAGSESLEATAVASRIQRVGRVEINDASAPKVLKTGLQVYAQQCSACHASGAAGAPVLGDVKAWAPRIKTGYDTLLHSALKGKGAMSAQGGAGLSDTEIGRAVVYLTNASGANFDEPKAPVDAATPTTASTAAPSAPTNPLPALLAKAPSVPLPAPTAAPAAATTAAPTIGSQPPPLYAGCGACHAAGIAGAPKLGDKAAWAARIPLGLDALTASVIKGKGVMPANGGVSASPEQIKEIVAYMMSQVK